MDDSKLSGDLENDMKEFNETVFSITTNKFDNYNLLVEEIANFSSQQQLLIDKSKNPAAELFFRSGYNLKFGHDLLCSLIANCNNEFSINDTVYNAQEFVGNYPDSLNLRKNCDSLNELNKEYEIIRNETSRIIEDKNISFKSDEAFLNLTNNFNDNIMFERISISMGAWLERDFEMSCQCTG